MQINQRNVMYDYRLTRKDLDGLSCKRIEYVWSVLLASSYTQSRLHSVVHGHERYYYYEYKEHDVLARAWTRHGGPDGLWKV